MGHKPAGAAQFLSTDHPDYELESYCFFGNLIPQGQPADAFFGMVQRMDADVAGFHFPFVAGGVGFNSPQSNNVLFGGTEAGPLLTPTITETEPWNVTMQSPATTSEPAQIVNLQLVSGTMGERGAVYRITADVNDSNGSQLEVNVLARDTTGIVQQGYGKASFFPQWTLPGQRWEIMRRDRGSVGKYLASTGDPMTGQGDYYYSAPLLDVESFTVSQNGNVLSTGHQGTLWFDYVLQSFDQNARAIVKNSSWNFFSIQFPKFQKALMVTNVSTELEGKLKVASLFSSNGPADSNGALEPIGRWNTSAIRITPVKGKTWTSPTGETYDTQYRVVLGPGSDPTSAHGHGKRAGQGPHRANLLVTVAWDDQQFDAAGKVAYEGLGNVHGFLDGRHVSGTTWLELQPAGSLGSSR